MEPVLLDRRAVLAGATTAIAAAGRLAAATPAATDPYRALLGTWMAGLLNHQVNGTGSGRINGGFLCPACALVHGRSGDAVYPLLAQARASGEQRYVAAALAVHDWSEVNTSRSDGSWVNDPVLSGWKGITVFRAIALAEALHRHGDLLPASARDRWRARLSVAMAFLDRFITIDTGNINYPISASYAYALSARVLDRDDFAVRGRSLAHQSLGYFTDRKLLYGEGRPQTIVTPKGCRPIDLGYNVEESLPALAQYAQLTDDKSVEEAVVTSLAAHLEFMLPDGAWDNSWGSRNYKWTYWGSRTSDGCQGAYALLAARDPRFREAARRNLELMSSTTAGGLLAGGPDYRRAGYPACIHHGMSHAKGLATVIDAGLSSAPPSPRAPLPRDQAYGLRSWPEIDTHLVAVGDWRATVTGYDFDYLAPTGGGHATGGTLTLLHHDKLGPLIAAGMTAYRVVEVGNQQVPLDERHRSNVPGVNLVTSGAPLVGSTDAAASVSARARGTDVEIVVEHRDAPAIDAGAPSRRAAVTVQYVFDGRDVIIGVECGGRSPGAGSYFSLPLIFCPDDHLARSPAEIRVSKAGGVLIVRSDAGLRIASEAPSFNLVPGFQFIEVQMPLGPDRTEVRLHYSAERKTRPPA